MASVYEKRGTWYLQYKNAQGRWVKKASGARTKAEAKKLAGELERKSERQGLGLEPMSLNPEGLTLGSLMQWWLDTYSSGRAAHEKNVGTVRGHIIKDELAAVPLERVTAGAIEAYLNRKAKELKPQSLNHLRQFIHHAF